MFKIAAAVSTLAVFTAVVVALPDPQSGGGRSQTVVAVAPLPPPASTCGQQAWPYYTESCLRVIKPEARPQPVAAPAPLAAAPVETAPDATITAQPAAVAILDVPLPASLREAEPPVTRPSVPEAPQAQTTERRPAPAVEPKPAPRRTTKSAAIRPALDDARVERQRVRTARAGRNVAAGLHQAYLRDAYAFHPNGISPSGLLNLGFY